MELQSHDTSLKVSANRDEQGVQEGCAEELSAPVACGAGLLKVSAAAINKASDARWRAEHLSAHQRLASAGVVGLAVPAPKVLWLVQ